MRWIGALVLLAVCCSGGGAQQVDTTHWMNYGIVTGTARATLEQTWDDSTAMQLERAYCVATYRVVTDSSARVRFFFVDKLVQPDSLVRADQQTISYFCPRGAPTVHVHPPATCDRDQADNITSCVIGGLNAWICQPGPRDFTAYEQATPPFQAIQCDKHAVVFWWNPKLQQR